MYSILIVDDEENIRKALRNAVDWKSLGFQILADVSNGIEALDYIENYDIDLLVTDIMMPIMGGIELTREAREIRPSMQIVFLTSYDQFDLAKQAIRYNILDYLLKPLTQEDIVREFTLIREKLDQKFSEILEIDEHYDTLKELQSVKKDLALAKLIHHGITEPQLNRMLVGLDCTVPVQIEPQHFYVVCVVKHNAGQSTGSIEVKNRRLFNIVKIISQKYLPCECSFYYDCAIIIAYGTKFVLDKFLPILAKDIMMSSKRVTNMEIYFGQSNYYQDIIETDVAYHEALTVLDEIGTSDAPIVSVADIAKPQEDLRLKERVGELETKMRGGDATEVERTLHTIFQDLAHSGTEPSVSILEILKIIISVHGDANRGETEDSLLHAVSFQGEQEAVFAQLTQLALVTTQKAQQSRQKALDVLTSSALAILHEEFSNPEMSLRMVADRIHCSPNYLSSIVRKATGKGFVDLLTQRRMEHAHDLLVNTPKKIREISEVCGYANQQYFSFSFKKYYDKSPNALRKELNL